MSAADLDPIAGRMGRLDCVCAPGEERGAGGNEGLARLAIGFGLAILAQTLVLAALETCLRDLGYACQPGAAVAAAADSYRLAAESVAVS